MKVKELFEDTPVKIIQSDVIDGHIKRDFYSEEELNGVISCERISTLKNLINFPSKCVELNLSGCHNLTSLEGCPTEVKFFVDFSFCQSLTSLKGAPKKVSGSVDFENSGVTSLEGIGKDYLNEVSEILWFSNKLKSHMLGVLKIKNLKELKYLSNGYSSELIQAQKIINSHLADRDIVKCRSELIEAGLKEYAKL